MANLICYNNELWKLHEEFQYTGSPQPFTLQPGRYLLECDGAEGGTVNSLHQYGGTSRGILNVTEPTRLLAYVGGSGGPGSTQSNTAVGYGGWNYGGCGSPSRNGKCTGNGGGGGTDIRLNLSNNYYESLGYQIPNENVPTEYQEVKFMTNASTSIEHYHLDTEFIPDLSTKIECRGYLIDGALFGFEERFTITCEDGKYVAYNMNWERIETDVPCDRTVHTFKLSKDKFMIDNTSYSFSEATPPEIHKSLHLFTWIFDDDTPLISTGCLYYFKIWNNDELIKHYIPCRARVWWDGIHNDYRMCDVVSGNIVSSYTPSDTVCGIGPDVIDPSLYARIIVAGGGGGCLNYSPSNNDGRYTYNGCGGGIVGGMFVCNNHLRGYEYAKGKQIRQPESIIKGSGTSYDANTHTFSFTNSTSTSFKLYARRNTIGKRLISSCKCNKLFAPYVKINAIYNSRGEVTHSDSIERDDYTLIVNEFIPTSIRDYVELQIDKQYWTDGGSDANAKIWDVMNELTTDTTSPKESLISPYEDDLQVFYPDQSFGYAFGYGMDAVYINPSTSTEHGTGGGGGGWYGGLTQNSPWPYTTYDSTPYSAAGGGGSGYVLTSESYKPLGYIPDAKYYMEKPFMESGTAVNGGRIRIFKQTRIYKNNDQIEFPCVGWEESVTLTPGTYAFECFGGDGSARYLYNDISLGGHTRGTVKLEKPHTVYCNVGGCGNGTFLGGMDYVRQLHPTLSWNGGGTGSSQGSFGSGWGGGATDFRLISHDEPNSLYSRFIVAGGAGGIGSPTGRGGAGGGTSGEQSSGGCGKYYKPGTQNGPTETGHGCCSGFGYGGNGYTKDGGYGGAGGSGWFGGQGCLPDYSADDDHGGSGGSGYVLTTDSYKPSGYLVDEDWYMSDIVNEVGASMPLGKSYAKIIVHNTNTTLILAKDSEGFKYYSNDGWILLSDQSITIDTFLTYGALNWTGDDSGLLTQYDIYAYDEIELNVLNLNVCPNTLCITKHTESTMLVTKVIYDVDYYTDEFSYRTELSRNPDDMTIDITFFVNKLVDKDAYFNIYHTHLFGRKYADGNDYKSEKSHPVPRRDPEQYRDRYGQVITAQWLLPVGDPGSANVNYKRYLSNDIDAVSPNWDFRMSVSCEFERSIYTAISTNDGTNRFLYIRSFSPTTGISRTEYLEQLPSNTEFVVNDILVTHDKLFLSRFDTSYGRDRLAFIDRTTNDIHYSRPTPKGEDIPQRFKSANGKITWWNSTTIMMLAWQRILLYNTTEDSWDYIDITPAPHLLTSLNQVRMYYDYAVGSQYICAIDEPYFDATWKNIFLINKTTGECQLLTNTFNPKASGASRYGMVRYYGGKFYVIYSGALVIIDEQTQQIDRELTGYPWNEPIYVEAYKRTIIIGNSTNMIYFYNIDEDVFNRFYTPWEIKPRIPSTTFSATYNNYTVYNTHAAFRAAYRLCAPVIVGGYCYIPYMTMGTIDMGSTAVYSMGFNMERTIISFDEASDASSTYDDRFVDAVGECTRIHNGNISYIFETSNIDPHIKFAHVDKSEYKKIIKVSFDAES